MKIVHIAPNAVYNDGWGYQDNLLPKYHTKLGHGVMLITTVLAHQDGKTIQTKACAFMSKDQFQVVRLPYKQYIHRKITNVFSKLDVYDRLRDFRPDVVFCHGLFSLTIMDVIAYKKRQEKEGHHVTIIQDSHADYYNVVSTGKITGAVLKSYYRMLNRYSQKYVARIYGVTPWREQYARDYFHIRPEKVDVLIMGADDEKVDFQNRAAIRTSIRRELGIDNQTFLIVTGGKIDRPKNIHLLMRACSEIKGIKLVVFGSVAPDLQEEFDALLQANDHIIYIGWLAADRVYDYFFAGDLAVFPGTHSVLWEQACACKIPCVFQRWEGMEHVNNGGNSCFISRVTEESLHEMILNLKNTERYKEMRQIAESEATDIYLYSDIARRSIACIESK